MKNKPLYVPLMNSNILPGERETWCDRLKTAGADAVFVALDRYTLFAQDRAGELSALADNIRFFRSRGFRAGVWIQAFGFGETEAPENAEARRLTVIRSLCGNTCGAFCPEDPDFVRIYMDWVKDAAACSPDLLMLDDDLCLSVRPGIGCICPRHKKLFSDALEARGLAPMPGDTALWPDILLTGKADPRRKVFFDIMGESLRRFCRAVRAAVDEADPGMRAGFCAGYTSWDIEGADALELARILAGATAKPFLRLTGAPYWVSKDMHRFEGQRLNTVIEFARLQEKWCRERGGDTEIFSEADSYPRPRCHVPSSYVECFDLACRAGGGMGCLKYLFDYYMPADSEMGYLRHHMRDRSLRDRIDELFDGKRSRGVFVYEPMRKICDMPLPVPFAGEGRIMQSAFSPAASLLTAHSIPVTYDDTDAQCAAAFGEAAREIRTLPKKLILDLPAAKLLTDRGVDTGLRSAEPACVPLYERFSVKDDTGLYVPGHRCLQFHQDARYECCIPDETAEVLSVFEGADEVFPSAFRYRSGDTEFLVLCADAAQIRPNSTVFLSYERQEQLLSFAGAFPHIKGQPGVYALWKEDEQSGAVLFLNLCEDPIFDCEIDLGREYGAVRLTGARGECKGNRICVREPVPPFAALAVEMER